MSSSSSIDSLDGAFTIKGAVSTIGLGSFITSEFLFADEISNALLMALASSDKSLSSGTIISPLALANSSLILFLADVKIFVKLSKVTLKRIAK